MTLKTNLLSNLLRQVLRGTAVVVDRIVVGLLGPNTFYSTRTTEHY